MAFNSYNTGLITNAGVATSIPFTPGSFAFVKVNGGTTSIVLEISGVWTGTLNAYFSPDNSNVQSIPLSAFSSPATGATGIASGAYGLFNVGVTGPGWLYIVASALTGSLNLAFQDGPGVVTTESGGSGGGGVSSVGLALPSGIFGVTGTPVTGSGTLTGTLATQADNTVFAGPTSGAAAQPTFRTLATADIQVAADPRYAGIATNVYPVPTLTQGALVAALALAAVTGGTVLTPPGTLSVTSTIVVPSGVNIEGGSMLVNPTGTSGTPDAAWAIAGGTYFVAATPYSYPCFSANNTVPGSAPPVFNYNQVGHCRFKNLAMSGFSYGIQVGATNNCGPAFAEFDNLFFDNISVFCIETLNVLHDHYSRIYMQTSMGGIHIGSYSSLSAPTGLESGNSTLIECYWTAPSVASGFLGIQGRAYLFDATYSTQALLNEICLMQVQANNYTRTELVETAATSTSSGITFQTGTNGAILLPGMPFVVTSAGSSGLTVGQEYVVQTVTQGATGTAAFTFGNSLTGAAVTPSASGNIAWHTYGFAAITILGGSLTDSSSRVNNVYASALDLEGKGVSIYAENAVTMVCQINDIAATGNSDHQVVLRNGTYCEIKCYNTYKSDVDASSTSSWFYGTRGTITQRTGRGMWNDSTLGIGVLALAGNGVGNTGDMGAYQPSGGNMLIPLNASWGLRVSSTTTSKAVTCGQGNAICCNGTLTLTPQLLVANTSASGNTGFYFYVFNEGTGTVTVTPPSGTSNTGTFNNKSGATTLALSTQYQLTLFMGLVDSSGSLFYTAHNLTSAV